MNGGRARRLGAALVCAVLLVPPASPEDQVPEGTGKTAQSGYGDDLEAIHAFALLAEGPGKMVGAREAAEALIAKDPRYFAGHFVLGYVLHVSEGNLALAYHHLKLARDLFEGQYSARPGPNDPWRWHLAILDELASVAREMDRWQEVLQLLDAHDRAYDPDEVASRGWPLLRLRRYDEARQVVKKSLQSKDPIEQRLAGTTLCGIEAELGRRQAAYDACRAPLKAAGTEGEPHIYTNAAAAALEVLKMDEAERLMLEGTRHFSEGNASNPWLDLMDLYLAQGRTAEATTAVREALAWRKAQPAYMDDQTGAETDFGSALFLSVVGKGEEAARITARILDRPDRTGFTSADSAQAESGNALLNRAALQLAAERKAEEASWSRGWKRVRAWADSLRLSVDAWASGRRAGRRLTDEDMLVASMRPYLPGGISVPVWMAGDLCAVLGPGVVSAALARARQLEDLPGAGGYFDAQEAEAALLRSDYADAVSLSRQALATLPRPEVLLQARAAAVGGQAALLQGDPGESARLFAQALQQDPGVVRRLGFALPAVVGGAGGAAAEEAVALLRRSPRFRSARGAFQVSVAAIGTGLDICLVGVQGENLGCARTPAQQGEDAPALASRAVAAFHEQAFAPRVDLTQGDLQSLDGSTTVARERSAKKIQGVIDAITGPVPAASPR